MTMPISEEMRAIKDDLVFWERAAKLLGWDLLGWSYKTTATFVTPGNRTLGLSGEAARKIINKARHRNRLSIIRSRRR